MKNIFYKWLIIAGICLSLSAISTASQAYTCGWRDGHRVCWRNTGVRHCDYINGHWHNGYYYRGHRVCWVN